jgi:hypothetical protein
LEFYVDEDFIKLNSIKFFLPNGREAISNDNMTVESEYFLTKLTIHNPWDKQDEGNYTCVSKDVYNYRNSDVKFIKFTDKPYLQFNSSESRIKIAYGINKTIIFNFTYSACPEFELKYFKDDEYFETEKYDLDFVIEKYFIDFNETTIQFKIYDINAFDNGKYTFIMSNLGGEIERNIELIVEGK